MQHLGFADNRWGQQVTRRRSDDVDTRIDIEPRTFHPESTEPAFASVADSFDGLPLPQRYWAMLTIALAVGMTVVDAVVANVALPTIARDLGASPAASIWVVNAYQISYSQNSNS